jgi:hypothetical protein
MLAYVGTIFNLANSAEKFPTFLDGDDDFRTLSASIIDFSLPTAFPGHNVIKLLRT